MNKDVIYIEPENDITDIIDKVKTSKSALVALVPPKKSTVLSSAVNFKLLARASRAASKNLVLVTAEPGLLKLAALAEIPVAKNLQTRPEVPIIVEDNSNPTEDTTEVIDDEPSEETPEEEDPTPKTHSKKTTQKTIEITETEEETNTPTEDSDDDSADSNSAKDDKKGKKDKKKSKVPNINRFRKWIILGSVGLVLIIGFVVWALVFAPSAKIIVSLSISSQNLPDSAKNISFVTDPKKEDVKDGIFALEKVEVTKRVSADFAATGETNKGEKATGTVTVYYNFSTGATAPVTVSSGTTFTNNGLTYKSTAASTLTYDPGNTCEVDLVSLTCRATAKVSVTATDPGEKFNTTASSGWTTSNGTVTPTVATIAGGTDKIVKIVSQKDYDSARSLLSATSESEGKSEVRDEFTPSTYPIEASLNIESKTPVSSPKVGEEVAEGVTPSIYVDTVFTMYGVDRDKINEFIEEKLAPTVPDGQKIYSTGVSTDDDQNKARIEYYKAEGDKITAKLASYGIQIGPDISETEIFEKAKGRKVGEVRTLLKPLLGGNGSVEIEPSFFWVSTIPNNPDKVEVIVNIEE